MSSETYYTAECLAHIESRLKVQPARYSAEIAQTVSELSTRAREFIKLRYYDKLEMSEIGEAWSVSANALWKYRRRVLLKLAAKLYPNG